MTSEAISEILDYFYSEATMATGTAGADKLLRCIDDVRDLCSQAPAPAGATEEFDMVSCAGEIIAVLNLASGKRVQRVALNRPPQSQPVTQDRKAVEQVLTRVLDGALKLTEAGEEPLSLTTAGGETGIKLALTLRETDLAERLATWLNADPDRVRFEDPDHVSLGIALMVAGKRLRALGGVASLDADSALSLGLPSHAHGAGCGHNARPGALNVLVAEDNDESFILTQLVLQDEKVWRARDGQDALEMIQKQRFDVVFMDVHMPGMNGYEVIRSMRDWETRTGSARTPMVVLSSDDLETQRRSAAEFGCSGFLRKPLQRWDLMPLLDCLK
jgi:CheY-like chemotaxis protein